MISGISAYRLCFAGCCFLTTLSFVVSDYLPMVDLPEHAAQLSIWQQWDDPALGHQAIYEFHPFVPLQTAYLLVVILGLLLPLKIALKVAVLGLVLGVPLSTAYMLKRLRLDPLLVFLAFPIAFSYSFYWGFINFLAAIPLVICLIVFVDRYSQAPYASSRRGAGSPLSGVVSDPPSRLWICRVRPGPPDLDSGARCSFRCSPLPASSAGTFRRCSVGCPFRIRGEHRSGSEDLETEYKPPTRFLQSDRWNGKLERPDLGPGGLDGPFRTGIPIPFVLEAQTPVRTRCSGFLHFSLGSLVGPLRLS